jgi:hypothetical protein
MQLSLWLQATLGLLLGSSAVLAEGVGSRLGWLEEDGFARGKIINPALTKSDATSPTYILKLDTPRCAIPSAKEGDQPTRIDKLQAILLQPRDADSRRDLQRAVGTRVNVQINEWAPAAPELKIAGATSSNFSITDKTDRVKTKAGELVVGKSLPKEIGTICNKPPSFSNFPEAQCTVIRWNGQPFMAAEQIGIERVYPSLDKPQIVTVWSHPGGNINPTTYHLVDVTGKTPRIFFSGEGLSEKLTPTENGILFQSVSGKTPLGDSYLNRFSYAFGSGKAIKTGQSINYSTTPVGSKERPEDILTDPKLRKPLLDAIGEKNFTEYRKKMGVAGGVTLYSGRYFFASGCKPHDCCGSGAAFVLDVINKEAWALEEMSPTCKPEDASVRIWAQSLPDDAIAKVHLGEWLKARNVEWSNVKLADPK